MNENKYIDFIENMKPFNTFGNLQEKEESKSEIITLNDLEKDIRSMSLQRRNLLYQFKKDVENTFFKYDKENDVRLEFNSRKLLAGLYFDFVLKVGDEEIRILLSKYRIEYEDHYSYALYDKMSQIYKYVEGLFRVLENDETYNLLLNSFYEDLYVNLDCGMDKLRINGDGISIPIYNPEYKIPLTDKHLVFNYFYTHKKEILERVLLEDNTILDRYRNDSSKRKVLSIYKRG